MSVWILVADQSRARLFSQSFKNGGLTELESFANPEGRAHNRDLETDQPPRVYKSFSAVRHAIEPQTSTKNKVIERFSRQLSDVLELGRVNHQYDQLVLIAPPKFLGILRSELNKHVQEKVVVQVNQELTTATAEEIQLYLSETQCS